jgi:hypothetical protein
VKARVTLAAVLVVAASAAFLAAGVTPASAYTGALPAPSVTEPFFNPANQAFVSSVLSDVDHLPTTPPPGWTNPATGSAFTSAQVDAGMAELETAAGATPLLGTGITSLALGAGALYVGWKLGSPLGNTIYRKITGDPGGYGSASNVKWSSYCASSCSASSVSVLGFNSSNNLVGSGGYLQQGWAINVVGCDPVGATGCTIPTATSTALANVAGTRIYTNNAAGTANACSGGGAMSG